MTRPTVPALAALAVWACLWRGASVGLLGFAGAVLVIALCQFAVLGHLSALRRAHELRLFRREVWWRGLAGGHGGRLILALPVTLGSALCIALGLVADSRRLLAGAALIALVLPPVARWCAARVDPVIEPAQAGRFVIRPAILVAGALAWVLALALRAAPEGLAQAVAAQGRYGGSSAALGQLVDGWAIAAGLGEVIAGQGPAGLMIALGLDGAVWFGLATALALMLVPPAALPRIVAPEGPARPAHLALAAFLAVVLVATLLSLAAAVERRAQVVVAQATDVLGPPPLPGAAGVPPAAETRPTAPAPLPLPSDLRRAIEEERIGSLLCPPGTIAELDAFEARLAAIYADQHARLTRAVREGFDAMRANVPGFLDWYYSLRAEYLRTAHLLVGSGDSYLRGQVDGHLNAGTPFAAATAEIAAIAGARDMAAEFDGARRAILAQCRGDLPADGAVVTILAERPGDSLAVPLLADRIAFEARVTAAGFGGLAAGVGVAVLAKVGAKVALGSVFKAAAAALAKIAGSKALGLLGGAGIGAAVGGTGGSVVPGAGTGIGAVVGGVVGGVAVMLGVDFTLIKLEEEISREGFAAEILAAIDATEAEFLAAIGAAEGAIGEE